MSSVRVGWARFGPPKCLQMDGGGEWENEVWADYCTERRIKLLFQGVGAHPWLLERRNGLARGIYNRLVEDDRFSSEKILGEVQWCLNTVLSTSGFSAFDGRINAGGIRSVYTRCNCAGRADGSVKGRGGGCAVAYRQARSAFFVN